MTNPLESPLPDPHDGHAGHDHGGAHDHAHDHALTIIEQPLDPASQSLSDALRASFRVLKVIMLIVVVLFLLSGVYKVDQNEVVIVSRLGVLKDPSGPGLHWAYPYPVDRRLSVSTSTQTLPLDTFWLKLSTTEEARPLSELNARGQGLDPAVDGALLTGDHAIMNLKLVVLFKIDDPTAFVINIADTIPNGERLLKSVLRNATIAEAAKATADELLKSPSNVARRIQTRAQAALDAMPSGITLEYIGADKSYYPLQTKDAFLQVSTAENNKRDTIQGAMSEQAKRLNGVAGEAWKELYDQVQLLDQHKEGPEREAVLARIEEMLTQKAAGEAGGRIRLAQAEKQQVIAETEARVAEFEAYLPEYQRNPELVRQRLRQKVISNLFAQAGVSKWFLPPGDKQMFLSINKDPVQAREAERALMEKKVEGAR